MEKYGALLRKEKIFSLLCVTVMLLRLKQWEEQEVVQFDWLKFCTQHKIDFVTAGANTARGHISIGCPWCGAADPSHHLGLRLGVRNPVWGCLRDPRHRGRDPRRLVQRLLACTYQQALHIVEQHNVTVPDEFEVLNFTQNPPQVHLQQQSTQQTHTPKEFREFSSPSRHREKFLDYVSRVRGFGDDAEEVCGLYELRYALMGEYAWRIIAPVHNVRGELMNWVGRAIHKTATLRYRNTTASNKDILYNEHRARALAPKVGTVFVVEGVWDCIKLDYYGVEHGCVAVGILGTSITHEQIARAALLGNVFERIVVLMDPEAAGVNIMIGEALADTSRRAEVVTGWLPTGAEDPGALTPQQVASLCARYRVRSLNFQYTAETLHRENQDGRIPA